MVEQHRWDIASLPLTTRIISVLVVLTGIAFLIYYPGLSGGFLHDDFVNIVYNQSVQVDTLTLDSVSQAFLQVNSGEPSLRSRPVSQFTFILNHVAAGLDPYWFKLVNLFIHLVLGVCVYVLVSLLCRALTHSNTQYQQFKDGNQEHWIALLTAALWLFNPLHVSTVLYSVQRMAQLSTLFTVLGVILYLVVRLRQIERTGKPELPLLLLALLLIWPLGVFSKENAIILPLLCLLIEWTILRFRNIGLGLKMLHVVQAIVVVLLAGYLFLFPDFILATYQNRDFTLEQRLLTQSRVVWDYVGRLLIPVTSQMGLYNDDIPISTGVLQPLSTLWSLIAWGLVVILAICLRRRQPIFSFGVFWFLLTHLIESSFIGLELVYEHRNYLPSIGLLFLMAFAVIHLIQQQEQLKRPLIIACCLISMLFSVVTFVRVTQWSDEKTWIATEASNHPGSYRANAELARLLIANGYYQQAAKAVAQAEKADKVAADIYFTKLSLEHILKGEMDEAFYTRMYQKLSTLRVYDSIINKLTAYITDAKKNDWEDTQQLIEITQAIRDNPYMSSNKNQGNMNLVLAKLYSDLGETELFEKHITEAYRQFPGNISITKVYIYLLLNKKRQSEAEKILDERMGKAMSSQEHDDFMQLKAFVESSGLTK